MKVSNPLTIIAIFSGLAETLATIALVRLPPEMQQIFIYFVMAFPASIVLLFFFVLYFKNTVLYAPSDYEDQAHYLEVNNIKKVLSNELDRVFSKVNAHGVLLASDEIEKLKHKIERSVDDAVPISMRESQVLSLVADGLTMKEMSERLSIREATVHLHLQRLSDKGLITKDNKYTWKLSNRGEMEAH